jgi:sterol desaturase/sphingolipid hydroxylase (fatty acid hydroxylase superfamily)
LHYGLYFTLWDRVFGTEDATYAQRLQARGGAILP